MRLVTGLRGVTKQFMAAGSANLAVTSAGVVMGWTSPTLPKLPQLSDTEGAWLGSLPSLTAAVGPFLGGWVSDRFGRRATMLASVPLTLISFVMLLFAENIVGLMYASRLLAGAAVGIVYAALPMYVGEVCQADIRGPMSSLMQLSFTIGFMTDYAVGPYVSYEMLIYIGMALAVAFAVTIFWMPESPYQLIAVGKLEEAEKSLSWLRDSDNDVTAELKIIKEAVEESMANKGSFRTLVTTQSHRRALIIAMGVVASEQTAGINAVLFYGQSIFEAAAGDIDSRVSQIIIGGTQMVLAVIMPFFVYRINRKVLLIFSSTGMSCMLITLGVYFTLSDSGKDVSNIGWLPVTSLVLYIIVYNTGYGVMPFTVAGEIFAPNAKALGGPIASFISWFTSFLVTRFFSDIIAAIGNAGPFFIFGCCALMSSAFVYFVVPETRGRTLEEIQEMLKGSKMRSGQVSQKK